MCDHFHRRSFVATTSPPRWDDITESCYHGQFSDKLDEHLDAAHGSCAKFGGLRIEDSDLASHEIGGHKFRSFGMGLLVRRKVTGTTRWPFVFLGEAFKLQRFLDRCQPFVPLDVAPRGTAIGLRC